MMNLLRKTKNERYQDNSNINPLTCSKQLFSITSNSKQHKVEDVTNLPKRNDTDADTMDIRLEILNKACIETTVQSSYVPHNTNYPKSHRTNTVDTQPKLNNRPQSVDNNLSNVYSRNPRTPAQKE